jgi:hypothetical protein
VDIEQNTFKAYVKKSIIDNRNCIWIYYGGYVVSKIGQWVLDQVDAGKLIYVEGRGYVKPDDFACEYMKTKQFKKEFDKAFYKKEEKEDV